MREQVIAKIWLLAEEIYSMESISRFSHSLPLNDNVSLRERNDQRALEFQISFFKQ